MVMLHYAIGVRIAILIGWEAKTMTFTSMDPEEKAYNTYSGAHSRSGRRARVIYPDGKLRVVTVGLPDTFFSIPAHGRIAGKYVSGFVSMDTDIEELIFHVTEHKGA